MNEFKELSIALDDLQKKVIGLYKHRSSKTYDMIVAVDGDQLKTVHIGSLGGMQVVRIPASHGKVIMFDDNMTLDEIKTKNPYRLHEISQQIHL